MGWDWLVIWGWVLFATGVGTVWSSLGIVASGRTVQRSPDYYAYNAVVQLLICVWLYVALGRLGS